MTPDDAYRADQEETDHNEALVAAAEEGYQEGLGETEHGPDCIDRMHRDAGIGADTPRTEAGRKLLASTAGTGWDARRAVFDIEREAWEQVAALEGDRVATLVAQVDMLREALTTAEYGARRLGKTWDADRYADVLRVTAPQDGGDS